MPKNPPPPICPKCRKPMHFIVVKTGGRKFRCIDCDAPDPLQLPEVAKATQGNLTTAAVRPLSRSNPAILHSALRTL